MARSKRVDPEQATALLVTKLQSLIDTARSRKARKFLLGTGNTLAANLRLIGFLLNHQKLKPRPTKKQLDELFRIDAAKFAKDADYRRMTTGDLAVLEMMIDYYRLLLTGDEAEARLTPKQMIQFLSRQSTRRTKPRKYKPEFVAAFKERQRALKLGRGITVEKLTEHFTPAAFESNEASAIRKMGQALKRIELDHKRLKTEGLESPYEFVTNENIPDKNVRQHRNR